MKQFFKIIFASLIGFILGIFLLVIIFGAIAGGIASSVGDKKAKEIKSNSVLELNLNYAVTERTVNKPISGFDLDAFGAKTIGLTEIISNIKKASKDDKIKGIEIKCGIWPNDYATLEEIRNELITFKKSGKFIVAYGEIIDEHSYYLASVADKIYLNPAGEILLNGFSTQVMYLKNLFAKIGVEPQLIRHGKYKSAGEPLIADKMSDENRTQIESYMGNIYNHYVTNIAKSRKIDVTVMKDIIENLRVQSADLAVKYKVIDSLKFEDEVEDAIKKMCNLKEDEKLEKVTLKTYTKVSDPNLSISDNKIAVLYLVGDINSGRGDDESIGSEKIAETIKKIRTGDKYKAIVIRVNSPGGSALASDVIWREITLAKKKMPVVVSMGAVAASGGYYIAAPANKIFAQPNTITGSIGVFGLLLNAKNLINDKLGIKIETVKFGKYADLGSPDRPLTADERQIIQNEIDKIYKDFVGKVATGRKLTAEQVDEIAQGRVWSGTEAKKLGLVDEFGGLNDAIAEAAKLAKLTEYRTVGLPEVTEPFEVILEMFSDNAQAWFVKNQIGEENYKAFNSFKKVQHMQGIQVKMPYSISIN